MLAVAVVLGLVFRPKPGPERIVVSDTITGVRDRVSYAWIIRTPRGAALIDTTADPKGRALLKELEREQIKPEDVHTILLTHGHQDHWAASWLFPNAVIRIGRGDAPFVTGTAASQAPARFFKTLFQKKGLIVPEKLNELPGDVTFDLDGLRVQAISAPGHTPGSMMYLIGDVLFAGDTLRKDGDQLVGAPWFFSEDPEAARASLDKLRTVEFKRVADGHGGLSENGKSKLMLLLAQ